jgi:hypothetical protein
MIRDYLDVVFWVILSIGWLTALVGEFRRRRGSGAVLVDFGGKAREAHVRLGGALLIWSAIMNAWGYRRLPMMACFAFLLLLPKRHDQIRAAGILTSCLIRWDEIAMYRLGSTGVLQLQLRDGGWAGCSRPLRQERQQEVCELLASRLPGALLQAG